MYKEHTLSSDDAFQIRRKIVLMATEDGDKPIAVAVCGVQGEPIELHVMNGAPPISGHKAIEIARAAVLEACDTIESLDHKPGGVIIEAEDRNKKRFIIGGIGVYGRDPTTSILAHPEERKKLGNHELADENRPFYAYDRPV